MKNKINEAFDNIDDKYIAQTQNPPKKRRALKIALIAAALALIIAAVPVVSVMSRRAAPDTPTGDAKYGTGGDVNAPIPTGQDGTAPASDQSESGGKNTFTASYDYSGAKFQSVANTKVTAYEVYGEDNDKHFQKYLQDAKTLDGFFDKLTQKLIDGEDSAVVSPVNIYMALSLLAECTDGDSRKEILDVIGVSSLEQLREQSKRIWLYNNRDDETGRSLMANSIWLSYGFPAKESCAGILKNDHYASVFCGDFTDNNYILALKQWLSDQTNGLLDSQIGDLMIPPSTTAAIISALYYKTRWQNVYNNKYTGVFNGIKGQKNCEFNTKSSASYVYFGDGFTAYHDALSDGNTVWFFLPDEDKTAADILKTDLVTYINSDKESKFYDVTVSMPDFDVSYNDSIIDELTELGIKTCTTGDADFSPLLDGEHYLDEVIHAARFKTDKDGVEGAAYTVMALDECADVYIDIEDYYFTLDRPFVFAVVRAGVPLFFGCVNDLQ